MNDIAVRIIESLKEMKLIREGKLSKKSWWDYLKEQKIRKNDKNMKNKVLKYNEGQYKKYCDLCLIIANGTIIQGLKAHLAIEEWIKKENISEYAMKQMDKRMEDECEAEMKNNNITQED